MPKIPERWEVFYEDALLGKLGKDIEERMFRMPQLFRKNLGVIVKRAVQFGEMNTEQYSELLKKGGWQEED